MADPFIHNSNIFGQITSTSSAFPAETASAATTAAGKLADHLKYLADSTLNEAATKAEWLAVAANAGQNGSDKSLVGRTYVEPDRIDSAKIVNGWKLPDLPALLNLPALPDTLKVDTGKLRADWLTDISTLQGSWMAKYLPDVTNVAALDDLFKSVLNGSAQLSFENRLASLESATTSALLSITSITLATLTTSIAASQANLAGNIVTQKANIDSAIATAKDNTQTIAWQRARDQAAREGKRLEDEALTSWASRGFSLPGGVLLSEIQKRRQATLDASLGAATAQAVETQKFFIELARSQIDAWQHTLELQNRAEIESFREVATANLKVAEIQVDANKFNADLAVKHLGLTLDFTKFAAELATKYRTAVLGAMNDLIRAYAGLRSNEVEYARAIATAQQQAVTSLVDYYRAALQSADVGLRVELANNENTLRYIATAAQFVGTAVGHHVNAASQAALAFANLAGHALSGLNSIATVTG